MSCSDVIGKELADALLNADQSTEQGIIDQRKRVDDLKAKLDGAKAETNDAGLQSKIANLAQRGRHAGQEERLDRRWRRLGL